MRFWTKLLFIVSVSFLCVGCDQSTKTLASNYLPKFQFDSYLFDLFRIGYAENTGAFLGIGSSLPSEYRYGVFIITVSVVLLGLLSYVVLSKNMSSNRVIAFTLLISGGGSNLYDRIVNNGAVIDFLNIGLGSIRTGVFNIADVAIVVGGIILFFSKSNAQQVHRHPFA